MSKRGSAGVDCPLLPADESLAGRATATAGMAFALIGRGPRAWHHNCRGGGAEGGRGCGLRGVPPWPSRITSCSGDKFLAHNLH